MIASLEIIKAPTELSVVLGVLILLCLLVLFFLLGRWSTGHMRFSLRTLLVGMTIAAIGLGLLGYVFRH